MKANSTISKLRRLRWQEPALYFIAVFLSCFILERLLKLRRADLSVPLIYEGDGFFYSMVVKAIITNGWFLHNDTLGAPFGLDMHDFPQPDFLQMVFIKFIGIFSKNFGVVFNAFYLITFPLTTACTLFVLRHFNISAISAIAVSLLYTFYNFHFTRIHHLFLSAYYPIPLMVLLLLWISQGAFLPHAEKRKQKLIVSVLICVLVANTGIGYYQFFSVVLLVSVALTVAFQQKSGKQALLPLGFAALITLLMLVNLVPNIAYWAQHGRTGTAVRTPAESELLGLKIAQLLVPVTEHRLPLLAEFKNVYNRTPNTNENSDSALGFIGGLGFLSLIGWMLYSRRQVATAKDNSIFSEMPVFLLDQLSRHNLAMVLLGTVGGFGSLFAHLVFPQIRSYNRLSVFIAFFSFFTIALLLDLIYKKSKTTFHRVAFLFAALLLTMFGMLDQNPKRIFPDYGQAKNEYQNDAEFVKKIEAMVPPQSMILQLPFNEFPEGDSADQLKGYLHSRQLRWSFPAMRSRTTDLWLNNLKQQPWPQRLETLAAAGFAGIYLDRLRLSVRFDQPTQDASETDIQQLLKLEPVVSRNNRLVFFPLTKFREDLISRYSKEEWELKKQEALHPILFLWLGDFSGDEAIEKNYWRWCGTKGYLRLINNQSQSIAMQLDFTVSSIKAGNLRVRSRFFDTSIKIAPEPFPWAQSFLLPPGEHTIEFTSNIPPTSSQGDLRPLVFRLDQATLKIESKTIPLR